MCHGLVYWCIYYLLWLSPIFATWGVIPVGFLSGFPLFLHLLFVLFFSYSLSGVIAWSPQMCFTCDWLLYLCVIVFPLVYLNLCLALCPCQFIPVRLLGSCSLVCFACVSVFNVFYLCVNSKIPGILFFFSLFNFIFFKTFLLRFCFGVQPQKISRSKHFMKSETLRLFLEGLQRQ